MARASGSELYVPLHFCCCVTTVLFLFLAAYLTLRCLCLCLSVGGTEQRVVAGASSGEFATASFMNVTLSCDHRVVDGAVGALWLNAFKGYMENPLKMLL